MDVAWADVADERRRLADDLDGVTDPTAWDADSLCAGWRARDVLGHLVWLAEGTRASIFLDSARELRLPSESISRIARRVGGADPADLVARLRAAADGRFVLPTQGPVAALGEVLAHRADMAPALRLADRPADARLQAVLEAYVALHRVFGLSGRVRAVRAVAADGPCTVGPADAPEVSGPGEQVLRAFTGRHQAIGDLHGPGLETLLGA